MREVDLNILAQEDSFIKAFYSFCTLITLMYGKKLNYANIFLLIMQNRNIRELFKGTVEIESDMLALKVFLHLDPTLYKSKYIMKYINLAGKNKLK